MRGRTPTMMDVAIAAGVSQKTVSRVVNNAPHVRTDVRARVVSAIKELGYHPNISARLLVTKQPRTVGAVLPASALYGPSTQLQSLETAARRRGFTLSVAFVTGGGDEDIRQALLRLGNSGVAGIVLAIPFVTTNRPEDVTPLPPTVVFSDHPVTEFGWPAISMDQQTSVRHAVDHLLDLGHETVHHLAGPQQWWAARLRTQAWREALTAAGRSVPDPVEGDFTIRAGFETGMQILQTGKVSAVFAANDDMALGLLRAARVLGLAVPDELSIVGFDDSPFAEFLSPPLTSVRQNFDDAGEEALQLLSSLMGGTAVPNRVELPTELVIRQSTGAHRAVRH